VAEQEPHSHFVKFACKGPLNEYLTPSLVGPSALTDCNNLLYHREGSWGKRPGAGQSTLPPGAQQSHVSGFRWYKAWPNPLTKLVLYEHSHLFVGNDQFGLVDHGNFAPAQQAVPPSFCSARDPQAAGGNGSDILIITGLQLPAGSFATGSITITGQPSANPPTDMTISVFATYGANTVESSLYQILGTDTPASITAVLASLINQTAAYLNQGVFTPFLGESYVVNPPPIQVADKPPRPQSILWLGSSFGGAGGNAIVYGVEFNNSTDGGGPGGLMNVVLGGTLMAHSDGTPSSLNMTGGGGLYEGPLKLSLQFGDLDVTGLSFHVANTFTGCVTWHNHVWYWGDAANPDTLFASDINQPEAFTFMIQNGGMTGPQNGGYTIGAGDGDPAIQTCIPLGNALYVFKTNNIYMIEGYDFQAGEYQFSVTPQVVGYGIPNPFCAAVLENQLVFWSGRKFLRLAPGAYEPEHIGRPIPLTEGAISNGDQTLVRCVAGDFQVQSLMQGKYVGTGNVVGSPMLLKSIALWAVDTGTGLPSTVMVFDDEATEAMGDYAWAKWTGWNVGAWILYGNGPNPAGTNVDRAQLNFMDPIGSTFHRVGENANFDWGNPIPWFAQTGFLGFQSEEVLKNAHRLFLNVEATAGATIGATLIPGRIIPGAPGYSVPYPTTLVSVHFNPTLAGVNAESYNDMEGMIEPALQTKSVMLQLSEDGTSGAGFELISWGLDILPEEAFAG
jgi:hypothetical protein